MRLAGELLRTRFKKQLAFADDDVVVLDPAVGTGTYPLRCWTTQQMRCEIGLGREPLRGNCAAWPTGCTPFEILVGPYSVAHLRLSQRLREAGVTDKPANLYLSDTLESPNQPPNFTGGLLQARLTDERTRAQLVKKDTRVFVCLGNPPYDREQRDPDDDVGRRKGGWVRYGDAEQNVPTRRCQS